MLIRLIAEGDGGGVLVWVVGAIFIPSLALAFGTWTRTSKVFETVYLLLWYAGPMQQIEQFNFMNFEEQRSQTAAFGCSCSRRSCSWHSRWLAEHDSCAHKTIRPQQKGSQPADYS